MPITTSCPGCNALFRLPETLAGKQVRCQKCGHQFLVPLVLTAGEMPPAKQPAPVVAEKPPEPVQASAPPVPEPEEELLEAKLVEPKEQAKPAPVAPLPPESPPSVLWLTAALIFFVLAMLATGGAAGMWVSTHLESPARAMIVAPFHGVNKNKDFGFGKEKVLQAMEALPEDLFHDDGKTHIQVRLQFPNGVGGRFGNDGPFRLYRLHLKEGTMYNVLVAAENAQPKLQIYDGDLLVAKAVAQFPANRVMLGYRATRTGEHLIFISTQNGDAVNITLKTAPEVRAPEQRVEFDAAGSATFNHALRIEDALDPNDKEFGPYREYVVRLEEGKAYQLRVRLVPFMPILRISDGVRTDEIFGDDQTKIIDHTYRAARTGDHRIRITSENAAIGPYTLDIITKKK
jgi:predicted Zn finger-like uncharacterized protein